jgi:hypothetical protein
VWDPQCADACGGDANKALIAERIDEDVYKALYRDQDGVSFNVSRDSYGWFTDREVRIAEYFERVPTEKWIAQMTDGTVKDYDDELKSVEDKFDEHEITAERNGVIRIAKDKAGKPRIRRTVKWRVLWAKVDGSNILEGPHMYDWKRIPVVRCPGRYINIEGRKKFQSLIRHAKDAQRSYNSRASDTIERSALLPKAPYMVTETMIKGYEGMWAQANVESRPYLAYNVDPKAPNNGMPYREPPLDVPQGALALAQMAISDIQATIGFFDPALGNAEDMNRVSGKALVQHTKRSDLGTYEFVDGYQAALQLTWEMMIDMIPTVYDSQRVERIIGVDDTEKLIALNHPHQGDDGREVIINDLKRGAYDVTVCIGPSFQTARQETLATLIDAAASIPAVAQFCPDLLAKNIDTPDAQEMARRLRIPLIQQGIIKPTEAEKAAGIPPPDPVKSLNTQLLQSKVAKMGADAKTAATRAQNGPLETEHLALKTASQHLGNLKTAHEIGQDGAAAQAEAQANAADLQQQQAQGQQDLQQQQAEGQQDLQQQGQQHVLDMGAQSQAHALEISKAAHSHAQTLQQADEKHQQALRHQTEKHAQALAHAKELGAVKVKTAKMMPKKPKSAAK